MFERFLFVSVALLLVTALLCAGQSPSPVVIATAAAEQNVEESSSPEVVIVEESSSELELELEPPTNDRSIMNTHYNTILKQPRKTEGRYANCNRSLEPIIFVPGSFATKL